MVNRQVEMQARALQLMPPAIKFDTAHSQKDSRRSTQAESNSDKVEYVFWDYRLDATDKKSEKLTRKLRVLDDGTPEEYCRWRIEYDDVVKTCTFNRAETRLQLLSTILRGKARDSFTSHYDNLKLQSDPHVTTESDLIFCALNEMARGIFKITNAARRQKHYMRNCLYLGNYTVREWSKRLIELNKYYPYFPLDDITNENLGPHEGLAQDELTDILDRAKPIRWHAKMLESNLDVQDMAWDGLIDYYEKLEMSDRINRATTEKPDHSDHNNKRSGKRGRAKDNDREKGRKPRPVSKRTEACKHCGKWHPSPDNDCWTLEKNSSKKPKVAYNPSNKAKYPPKEKTYVTEEQLHAMIAKLPMYKNKGSTKAKRQVSWDSDNDSADDDIKRSTKRHSSETSDDEYIQSTYTTSTLDSSLDINLKHSSKKVKCTHFTTEVIAEIVDRHGKTKPIRCLLDTGTTATIILREYVAPGKANGYKGHPTKWSTMGGSFTTKRKALLEFKLPEFSTNKTIEWICHVDDSTDCVKSQYDIIIGTDLMTSLGLDISFSTNTIMWEDIALPMKQRGTVHNHDSVQYLYQASLDTEVLKEAEDRQKRILDANYAAVDIDEYLSSLPHLTTSEKDLLSKTLHKHPKLTV